MITTEQIESKVRELAERYPNNIHKKTSGENSDLSPLFRGENSECPDCGCILGIAAIECGYIGSKNKSSTFTDSFINNIVYGNISNNPKWFNLIWSLNDEGKTWKECVETADRKHPIK